MEKNSFLYIIRTKEGQSMELKNDITRNPIGLGAACGAAGATAGAAINYIGQKNILKNGDEFLKRSVGQLQSQKKFHNAFFDGTQEAAEQAIKKIDDSIKAIQDYVKGGKVNFKQVGKYAAVFGGALALIGASMGILNKRHDKELENAASILNNQFTDNEKV